jgi:hypothetical protein
MSNNIFTSALTYVTNFFNNDLFNEAIDRERYIKTPNKRVMAHAFKNTKYTINLNFKYFSEYIMVDDSVVREFEEWNYENAQTFFYKNITKIKKVICIHGKDIIEYYLRKGKLHNENDYAYSHKTGKQIISGFYFLNGKSIDETEWKIFSRHLKLNRIFKNESA